MVLIISHLVTLINFHFFKFLLVIVDNFQGKGNHFEQPPAAEAETNNAYKPKILGIYMPASAEYIMSVMSILRCGEAFLPLDPSWPKDRILSIVSSSNADLVITSSSSFAKGKGLDWDWGCPVLCFSIEESVGTLNLVWPCEKEKQRSFCYLMYTSGSTGKPKGVCGTEQGLLNRFLWMQELYPLCGEEVLLFKTSISFVDHLQEFLGALLTACTLVIPSFNKLKEYPFSIVNFLQVHTCFFGFLSSSYNVFVLFCVFRLLSVNYS